MKRLSNHRLVTAFCALALAFVAGGFLWAFFALRGITGSPLILHFNDLSGITSVGTFGMMGFMAALGALVTVMNFFIALELDARDGFLGKLVAGLTLIFAALLFIAFAAIINANV